jgi:hypothetical protein
MNAQTQPQASPLSEHAMERLETEITALWGHINAAEYRFLELLAEFDRVEGYARHGLGSAAHWLNWQCGIGAVAARERVRVARALAGLPAISAAFRRGEISYSKVRAMTRVATPANEAILLNVALNGTAHHVENLVRRYRRARRAEEAARSEALHRDRYVQLYYDDDGALTIHAKLPPEVGALVAQAIEATLASLEAQTQAGQAPDEIETQSNVSAETFSKTVSEKFAGTSADDSARERVADPLAARRADALVAIAQHALGCHGLDRGSAADRYQVVVHIDQAALAERDAPAPERWQRSELADGPALAIDTARRLGCDAALVGLVEDRDGNPLDVGRRTRAITPALKRALASRDGGCRFPGCTHKRFTEGHHVEHWADGGETKLGNLVTLCGFHHRLVHEGGFGLTVTDDGVFVFTRPDGTRIAAAAAARGGAVRPLFAMSGERGLAIDTDTARCGWQGETMDYGLAAEAIYYADHPDELARRFTGAPAEAPRNCSVQNL